MFTWIAVVLVVGAVSLVRPLTASAQVPPGCTEAGVTVTCTFGFTGEEQTFTVPPGIGSIQVIAIGGRGGSNFIFGVAPGGDGAEVRGTLTGLVPGEQLYVEVGGGATSGGCSGSACHGGFNGGGSSSDGGGGGGASDVRTEPRTSAGSLSTRLVVAAGGGGGGAAGAPPCDESLRGEPGGNAGAPGGTSSCLNDPGSTGGGAGTQSVGGSAGIPNGGTGSLGLGGNGGHPGPAPGYSLTGGGGGGGLYGGGGGGGAVLNNGIQPTASGGGGGGSSLVPSGGVLSLTTASPSVTISYGPPKGTPTIATTPSAASTVGTGISDTATVSGGSSPTGSVSFSLYGPGDATCSGTPLFTSTGTLSGGTADSGSYTATAPGTYHWAAAYGGDANNLPASSPCATESSTVSQATPIAATRPSAGGAVGTAISDSVAVSGGFNPTGSVTFRLYGPDDPICSGTVLFSSTDALSGGSADSASYTATAVGTYHWVATYDGDGNNLPIGSACATESVTISQASPSLGTTPPPAGAQGPSTSSTPHLSLTAGTSSPAGQGGSTSSSTPGLPQTGAPPKVGRE